VGAGAVIGEDAVIGAGAKIDPDVTVEAAERVP
jgi:UDP-3-O-[3-hydroxymyristoyl] glucosamine N-acyltransferase